MVLVVMFRVTGGDSNNNNGIMTADAHQNPSMCCQVKVSQCFSCCLKYCCRVGWGMCV